MAFILFGFIPSVALTEEVPVADITYIAPWDPHVDVLTNAPFQSLSCGTGNYYRIDLAKPGAKAKLSTILTAFVSGKKVGLSIGGCIGNAPEIRAQALLACVVHAPRVGWADQRIPTLGGTLTY